MIGPVMGSLSLAFASAFLYAFWGLGLGAYRGRLSNWIIILVSSLGGIATYAVLGTIAGSLVIDSADVAPALIGGVLNISATYLLLMAYQRGKVAIATAVAATSIIVPLGYSIFSGEAFTRAAVIGAILMLIGLAAFYMASIRSRREGTATKDANVAILLALGAALLWGVATIVLDVATRVSLTGTMLVSLVPEIAITAILVVVTARHQVSTMTSRAYAILIGTGVLLALANIAFFSSANEGNIGITSVIASLDPLILAFLAMIFFKQRLLRSEWVAFAIVVTGSCVVVL